MRGPIHLIRIRTSFWYLPCFYALLAIGLVYLSLKLDSYVMSNERIVATLPNFIFSDLSLSQTILGSLAASLLTMTTITFSTILVVLTTYLSEFSPRALQNFITDHSTQRVLGIFTGGFVYCVLLLLFMKEWQEGQLFIVPTFAVLIAILCLVVFIIFIQHVTTWIQVSNLLHDITTETIQVMERLFAKSDASIHDAPWDDWESGEIKTEKPISFTSENAGYIQYVNIDKLVKFASELDCIVRVERKQGDYINEETPLLSVWGKGKVVDKDLLMEGIIVSAARAPLEDVHFGIQKVTEIAVRALSSGINDPSTAIHCVDQLAVLLSKLTKFNVPEPYFNDSLHNLRVIMNSPKFFDYLYFAFAPIYRYGKVDPDIVEAIVNALILIGNSSSKERKIDVWQFTEYVLEGYKRQDYLTIEQKNIESKLEQLSFILGTHALFKKTVEHS